MVQPSLRQIKFQGSGKTNVFLSQSFPSNTFDVVIVVAVVDVDVDVAANTIIVLQQSSKSVLIAMRQMFDHPTAHSKHPQ